MWMVATSQVAASVDYVPVTCDAARPYEGQALYPGPPALPFEGSSIGPAFDAMIAGRLDRAMDEAMLRTRSRAMTAAVASREGRWKATRAADDGSTPARFYWASVGKALTATVILQLVEEGRLSLDDRLSRWLPDFPNSEVISVDHLLHHTASVFSANEDLVVRRDRRYRTPDENIAIAKKHGSIVCPGQRWRYSNTGYEMLGRIIEEVERRPYRDVIRSRIAERLGLATLAALSPGEFSDAAKPETTTSTEPAMIPSWGNAAGNIVASAEDMLTFMHALLTAKLLRKESTLQMFDGLYPMFDAGTYYGRGVMLYSFVDGGRERIWLGHSGGAPGVKAIVAFSLDAQAFVAVALSGDGSAEATANLLLRQLSVSKDGLRH